MHSILWIENFPLFFTVYELLSSPDEMDWVYCNRCTHPRMFFPLGFYCVKKCGDQWCFCCCDQTWETGLFSFLIGGDLFVFKFYSEGLGKEMEFAGGCSKPCMGDPEFYFDLSLRSG